MAGRCIFECICFFYDRTLEKHNQAGKKTDRWSVESFFGGLTKRMAAPIDLFIL
ncbi:hypothetical protein J2T02_005383 [Chitinophaga terrae (ex Kim and Jung 2007)]|jgi:hypothetical protein|nr:hypothetical protein [Chitinophaga terrae (ex Kim and Jung 2007)]